MILWNVLQQLATWDNELCGLQTSVQRLFEDGYCCTCKALLWGTRATSGWINEVGCLQSSSFLLHTHCTFETILNFDWLMGRKCMYIYCIFLKQCWNLTDWRAEKYLIVYLYLYATPFRSSTIQPAPSAQCIAQPQLLCHYIFDPVVWVPHGIHYLTIKLHIAQ